MADILDKLFGSSARVKVMRFFLRNPEGIFALPEISKTLRLGRPKVRREANFLASLGFLRKGAKEIELVFKSKKRVRKKKEPGFFLNPVFPYRRELAALFLEAVGLSRELLARRLRSLGRGLKLALLTGVFVRRPDAASVDVLLVGDNLRRSKVEKTLGRIESELGKELKYTLLSVEEFNYRKGMYDKFVMDILENEHEVLIDSLGA